MSALGVTGVATCHSFAHNDNSKLAAPFFKVGVANNPKFDKRHKGGEDGFSISASQRMIMVADGVGGWTTRGVDPGKYAKFLCNQAAKIFDD